MAARDDLKANAYFGQHSAAAVVSVATTTLTTRWSYNMTSITRSNVGIYVFNFKPFDFTGTTFPLFVYATVGHVGTGAGLKLFATYSIVSQTQVEVYTWLHDGTATELTTTAGPPLIYDTLSVLIVGRRNRPTTNGTSVIDPAASLLRADYNLGVTGL